MTIPLGRWELFDLLQVDTTNQLPICRDGETFKLVLIDVVIHQILYGCSWRHSHRIRRHEPLHGLALESFAQQHLFIGCPRGALEEYPQDEPPNAADERAENNTHHPRKHQQERKTSADG